MACSTLSHGVALVAKAPAPSSSPRLSYAMVRLPALRTAPSLTMVQRCAGGYGGNTAVPRRAPSIDDDECICFTRDDPDDDVEAGVALLDAVAGAFRPLLDNLKQLRSVQTVFNVEDYHVGMPFGAILACLALWQMWKMDPSTCLDFLLAYAFYKLSVLAADVRKQGFCNDLITRVQFVIVVTMALKDIRKSVVPLDYIRDSVFFLYTMSVLTDLTGTKKFVNPFFSFLLALSKAKHGILAVMRLLAFDDFSCFGPWGVLPKMEGLTNAQQVELEQPKTRIDRLFDDQDDPKIKAEWDAQWMEICQTLLAPMPLANDEAIGLKTEDAHNVPQLELNDGAIGPKMKSLPDVQRVEVGQIVAHMPCVTDEVIETKMGGGHTRFQTGGGGANTRSGATSE
ncbi:hypothetical protein D1007_54990 [Hordeum vulgare]|nr:hypothetical protein D1007_54990 [Hordeum vulgare]